jgi:hypothetical protein
MHLTMYWLKPYHSWGDIKCIKTRDDRNINMAARKRQVCQQVLTKPITIQRAHKIHLNMCWPPLLMKARTHNASQHVLTKLIQCQRGHRMHLNLFWPNTSHASEDTKYISACVDQFHPVPAKTEKFTSTRDDQTHPKPART